MEKEKLVEKQKPEEKQEPEIEAEPDAVCEEIKAKPPLSAPLILLSVPEPLLVNRVFPPASLIVFVFKAV